MKKAKLLLVVINILMLWPLTASSQYIVDYKKQGDQYFAQNNYYAAGVFYQKALNLLPDTTGKTYFYPYAQNGTFGKKKEKNAEQYQYLVYQLGEAFRNYKDYQSAEQWYSKVLQFKNNTFPLARLWYAVCLRADQKYREAIDELRQFQTSYTQQDEYSRRATLELKSCEYALDQMTYPRLADIRKLPAPINDSGSNYAPVLIGDSFYFTSSRPLNGINAQKENPYVNKIYRAEFSGEHSFNAPEVHSPTSDIHTELAAATFSPASTRMYLTEWQEQKGKKKGIAHYTLVVSKKSDSGAWSAPVNLSGAANAEGYDTKEPFITPDGQYLIFSSNRPGGEGGYDLWYCPLDIDGMPSGDAVNLGPAVNTPGDETNPYFDPKKNLLIFSSNGRVGLGGFDLYKSNGNLSTGLWSPPEDMGYPINSAKDDNFYYPAAAKDHFYTSSDRQSVCCLELYNVGLKHIAIAGTIYDCDTQKPLPDATVTLTDSISNKVIKQVQTNGDGKYRFEVINRKPLKLNFAKDKYFAKNMVVTSGELQASDTLFSKELCLKAFEVGKPIVIPNILYDFDKATLRPESKSVLDSLANILEDNPKLIVQMSAHTDSVGTDEYNMNLSQRRAQSCVDYLISRGIPASRMQAKGYGETRPIAPNSMPDGSDNPAGRQLNRRTEFTVLKD
jgi:outer membrane protein OmpA-like peptidoglycan-associated protein/tetratricopeptide (TPR) repeat protein